MRAVTITVGPLATAAANNICLSQTPAAAGALTLNGALVVGGVAILDTPRRILLTTNANETAKTFTVVGTIDGFTSQTEVITGVTSSTATSVLDYKTVTSITVSAATAGAVTFGTTTIAASTWARMDEWTAGDIAIQCNASGTVNYTVQQTLADPNSPTNPVAVSAVNWVNSSDTSAVGATGTIQSNYLFCPSYVRILLNSGTGSVTATLLQSGA